MKLAAKFARQEDEEARLARITRRRVTADRTEVIRRMLGLSEQPQSEHGRTQRGANARELLCPECHRRFSLAMHLGRHVSATHQPRKQAVAG